MAKNQTPQQIISRIQGILGEYSSQSGGRTLSNQDKNILEKGMKTGKRIPDTNMSQPRAKGGAVRKMAKGGMAKKKK
jgi:hypothetical protein